MEKYFESTPVRVRNVSAGYLRAFLQQCYQDSLSGLLQVTSADRTVIFLHVRGSVIAIFRLNGESWEKLERGAWEAELSRTGGDLRSVETPVDAVRLMRQFFLSPIEKNRTITVTSSEIPGIVAEVQKQNFGSLYHAVGESNEVFILVAGASVPHVEVLLVTPQDARFECSGAFPENLSLGTRWEAYCGDTKTLPARA
jgi:hypothetical protein